MFGYADRTTKRLKGNFVALSTLKFSSNVVEKILHNASIGKVMDIINEIVEDPNVLELFEDCYDNFVIQKTLTTTAKWPNNIFDAIAAGFTALAPTLGALVPKNGAKRVLLLQKNRHRSRGRFYCDSLHH
ncbi:hypothetical protein Syun_007109 [Stephania yunnanensis]|uniref:PUM-HD domain-containing protein n=1 Tax=Stephania yunnanensis TaxID=152371 RepID=A0AAP0KXY2_9MAGN